ncbi:HNH endonuclease [Pseudomonas sp. LTJR-52]|uniref:HNH endonuclease n=1 Tax=Pseudomonas sp. LTJR-52 TaxID=2479392 RepID=UPI000EFA7203|nr:HNH endonuclease [Pseudomonas sp. LTJR-52]AYN94411.1 HNH endonuclease [Pseudomonas sp. LTJR-52]
MITQEQLKAKFHYSPLAGVFEKRVGTKRKGYKWVLVGTTKTDTGYASMQIMGKRYLVHRLAWLYVYGKFPDMALDHIDGDRLNNAISNLREVTAAQNVHNSQKPSHNKSGVKGVSYCEASKTWTAQVAIERRPVFMKRYKTKEEAIQAVRAARELAHGEYANHGIHKFILEDACNTDRVIV